VFDLALVRCRMLKCVAVCCGVLRCVAVCCSVMQCDAVWCSMLRSVLHSKGVRERVAVCFSVLQYVAPPEKTQQTQTQIQTHICT